MAQAWARGLVSFRVSPQWLGTTRTTGWPEARITRRIQMQTATPKNKVEGEAAAHREEGGGTGGGRTVGICGCDAPGF
jgi:hypothetical protein